MKLRHFVLTGIISIALFLIASYFLVSPKPRQIGYHTQIVFIAEQPWTDTSCIDINKWTMQGYKIVQIRRARKDSTMSVDSYLNGIFKNATKEERKSYEKDYTRGFNGFVEIWGEEYILQKEIIR